MRSPINYETGRGIPSENRKSEKKRESRYSARLMLERHARNSAATLILRILLKISTRPPPPPFVENLPGECVQLPFYACLLDTDSKAETKITVCAIVSKIPADSYENVFPGRGSETESLLQHNAELRNRIYIPRVTVVIVKIRIVTQRFLEFFFPIRSWAIWLFFFSFFF